MSVTNEHLRRRRLERHCAASIRAIVGKSRVEYRQQRLFEQGAPVNFYSPLLAVDASTDALAKVRGVTDSMALRLSYSDRALHRSKLPEDDDVARLVFDTLEQLRTEALVPAIYVGVRKNMQDAFERWCGQCRADTLLENELGELIYGVTHIVRSRLIKQVTDPEIELALEHVRYKLAPLIGKDLLKLRTHLQDQSEYSVYALNIANTISELAAEATGSLDENNAAVVRIRLPMPPSDDRDDRYQESAGRVGEGAFAVADEFGELYQVFTTDYDREITGEKMYRVAQRETLRRELDTLIKAQAISIPRLAQRLKRLFAISHLAGWDFGEDEGFIDGRRLSQLVSNPANHRIFKKEKSSPHCDTVLTFLVDTSGSMKRQRYDTVAVLVDIYCRALELAGVKTEILGFSTDGWSGGESLKAWKKAGAPDNPGRLNDRLHIVYKDADTPWRRSRMGISSMLHTSHYREGLDGEAMQWACERLANREESRKCVVMISDGAPMDSATGQTNGEEYLHHHLLRVVHQWSRRRDFSIAAIGIDLDMEYFFNNALSVDLAGNLGIKAFKALEILFSGRHPVDR
ncbi:MAG: cobaltochelatase CobT [Parvicella sp.]|jgi:cobaltochelatase CobT